MHESESVSKLSIFVSMYVRAVLFNTVPGVSVPVHSIKILSCRNGKKYFFFFFFKKKYYRNIRECTVQYGTVPYSSFGLLTSLLVRVEYTVYCVHTYVVETKNYSKSYFYNVTVSYYGTVPIM